MPSPCRRRSTCLACLAGLLLLLPACSTTPAHTDFLKGVEEPAIDSRQLRFRVLLFALFLVDEVERAAVTISQKDPELRRETLKWKVSASNAAVTDALQADPVIGMIGAWALSMQMRKFFEEGAGTELFGPGQEVALETCRRLEQEAEAIASTLSVRGEIEGIEEQIANWSVQFPFEDLLFSRRHTGAGLVDLLQDSDLDVFSEVRKLEDHADFVVSALPVLLPILTKQARWQAELVVEEALHSEILVQAARDLTAVSVSLEAVASLVDSLPETLATEREAALVGLDEQRDLLFRDVEEQREGLFLALGEELDAIEALTDRQRHEFFAALDQQRSSTLAAIGKEREAALADLSILLDRAPERVGEVVEEYWWRTALAAMVAVALCGVGGYIAARDLLRRSRLR